jgi:hypothetical protein
VRESRRPGHALQFCTLLVGYLQWWCRHRRHDGTLDVLLLDELGYVPASKIGSELLFDVISTA